MLLLESLNHSLLIFNVWSTHALIFIVDNTSISFLHNPTFTRSIKYVWTDVGIKVLQGKISFGFSHTQETNINNVRSKSIKMHSVACQFSVKQFLASSSFEIFYSYYTHTYTIGHYIYLLYTQRKIWLKCGTKFLLFFALNILNEAEC